MKRIPLFLAGTLVVIWLLLNGEVSLLAIGFGILLAGVLIVSIARLRPVRPHLRNLHLAVPILGTLLVDILQSNVAVAQIVLGLERKREVHSGFLDIPLELTDPHGLAILAMIVTSTPGTSWAGIELDGKVLRLHVLDLKDADGWIVFFKKHYEQPLLSIFQ
jgi:multicomponent K+:H+ antiporter subunit E